MRCPLLRIFLTAGVVFVGACADESQPLPLAPVVPPPRLSHVPLTASQIMSQITATNTALTALFPAGMLRTAAQLQFNAIVSDVKCANTATRSVPPCFGALSEAAYLKRARGKTLVFLAFTIYNYKLGRLGSPSSTVLQDKVINFIVLNLNLVGFHVPNISREVFAGDGAIGVCSSLGCTVGTPTLTAKLLVPPGAIPPGVTVIIVISRLQDDTPPVETELNTYPFYYDVSMTGLAEFNPPGVVFATCYYFNHPTFSPPEDAIDRLRIATADPESPNGVKIFDLAAVPPGMDCEPRTHLIGLGDLDFSSPRSVATAAVSVVGHVGSKAIGFFAPRSLFATNLPVAGGGIRTLSPKFIVDPGAPDVALIDCPITAPGDEISRGFYVPNYPGSTLSQVDLRFSSSVAGSYTFSLTARQGAYDGPVIGTSTATAVLTASEATAVQTSFSFSSPSVEPGTTVTFEIANTSGPETPRVVYDVGSGGLNNPDSPFPPNCEVVETEGTSPPLDDFRRNGVGVKILGAPAPAPVP